MKRILPIIVICTVVLLTACSQPAEGPPAEAAMFSADDLMQHIQVLADDAMEGRGIGTPGGEKAAEYIREQFENAGLQPAFGDSYYQQVPIRAALADLDNATFTMAVNGESYDIAPYEEVVFGSEVDEEQVSLSGDLWFVGYGIDAPEVSWDDYKGFDAEGKILVMLVNDPDLETTGFGSEEMTYYGRWTYKQEIARMLGASGLLLLHTDETARYGFNVVQTSWSKERIRLDLPLAGALKINGWISEPAINRVLKTVDLDFDALKQQADSRDFEPMPLGISLDARIGQSIRRFQTPNVAGVIPGSSTPREVVIYTGHYDHLGIGRPDESGDNIYNGAVDNATGIAAIIEMAKAYKAAEAPQRSVMFMAVTAEEGGLLGSKYYVQHPAYDLDNTAVVVNLDGLNVYGETDDFWIVPIEATDIKEEIAAIGEEHGMRLGENPSPGSGLQFRSDHFPFCARNVVALSMRYGFDYRDKPEGYGEEKRSEYIKNFYHQPADEIYDWWDMSGVVQMTELSYDIGRKWADGAPMPTLSEENNPFLPAIRIWNTIAEQRASE